MNKLLVGMIAFAVGAFGETVSIGSRLELMVDDHLIESMQGGAKLLLHHPVPREVVMVHDEPWEGNSCGYYTVFKDGDVFRMYYRGSEQTLKGEPGAHPMVACYAESPDGIHWTKPDLGLFEFDGSRTNNIIWDGEGSHDFTPFKDPNPDCPPDEAYKSVAWGTAPHGAYAFKSGDGIRWSVLQEGPIITKGAFDTQNLAFWDPNRSEYRAYVRDFRNGRRGIRTCTSKDFRNWTEPVWIQCPDAPDEQLYTNQIIPYYRAPHIYLGFPTRYIDRPWSPSTEALPELEHRRLRSATSMREGTALTDGLFMTSRDALEFDRWGEAFIRPGLRTRDNWVYGDNYQNWGIIQTKSAIDGSPDELSVYATESYWTEDSNLLRRFTIRIDGFVSLNAPLTGGEIITKPLVFTGTELALNFSTSAAGNIRIEIQDPDGQPIEGFLLKDAPEIFGDTLERVAPWKDGRGLAGLSGKPVRLRFVLSDADLYSFRFRE